MLLTEANIEELLVILYGSKVLKRVCRMPLHYTVRCTYSTSWNFTTAAHNYSTAQHCFQGVYVKTSNLFYKVFKYSVRIK